MSVKLRPVVRWFAEQMELKLRENEHKCGWHNDHPGELVDRITEENRELRAAVRTANATLATNGALIPQSERAALHPMVVAEAADVANMAMMVADHYRDGGPSEDQGGSL